MFENRIPAHAVVGRIDGATRGGHIRQATVWPFLEVFLTETPGEIFRKDDLETGLAVMDLDR